MTVLDGRVVHDHTHADGRSRRGVTGHPTADQGAIAYNRAILQPRLGPIKKHPAAVSLGPIVRDCTIGRGPMTPIPGDPAAVAVIRRVPGDRASADRRRRGVSPTVGVNHHPAATTAGRVVRDVGIAE